MKRALITGIGGQDGYYLTSLLLSKGYRVYGLASAGHLSRYRIEEEFPDVELLEGDLRDFASLVQAVSLAEPDEVYNLGALSLVSLSFRAPLEAMDVTGVGALRMLEAVRLVAGPNGPIRFYQASSSEMFGKVRESPQRETTSFHPRSPYAAAKVFAHHATVNYREAYGLHATSGILFNHESPKRGIEFVTRKISLGVVRIALGKQDNLVLGNLEARRDWGFAGDYVEAMWLMLQQDEADEYVIATGEAHSVREFLTEAFAAVEIDDWSPYVVQDLRLMRPAEVDVLVGDASKARERLGWAPGVSFKELARLMVEVDLETEKASGPFRAVEVSPLP